MPSKRAKVQSKDLTRHEVQAALKLSAHGRKPGSFLPCDSVPQFWEVLGPELLTVQQDAFQAQHGLCMSISMTQNSP